MWLLRTPTAYTRLTEEIRSSFPTSAKNMKFTELAELPYMNACIDEALRIFPPVPTGLTRTVPQDRKSTRLNSSHSGESRMPSSA